VKQSAIQEESRAKLGKGNGRKEANSANLKFGGKCHNCGKKGQKKSDCYAEGGGREGQGKS
jgi:hypothetical protein